jgi:hypothetical protein
MSGMLYLDLVFNQNSKLVAILTNKFGTVKMRGGESVTNGRAARNPPFFLGLCVGNPIQN